MSERESSIRITRMLQKIEIQYRQGGHRHANEELLTLAQAALTNGIHPELKQRAIEVIQSKWGHFANEDPLVSLVVTATRSVTPKKTK